LGEAYFETAKYLEIKGDTKGAESRQFKALDHLEDLRKNYPTYARMDEALFVLANTYMERKMITQAGSVLSDIADRYPDSPVVQQASLLLGDHYFAEKQFGRAESFYLKAADDDKIKSYIHYKLGWNALNQDQPAKALKYFEMVLNERGGASDYSRDAAREMIWPAIQVYGTSKVASYLEKTLKDDQLYETSLSSLASGLQSKDEHQAASAMFDTLISRFPSSEKMTEWRMAQIKSEEALGHSSKVQQLVAGISNGAGAVDPATVAMLWGNAKRLGDQCKRSDARRNLNCPCHHSPRISHCHTSSHFLQLPEK
jgi:TolA-binding protein